MKQVLFLVTVMTFLTVHTFAQTPVNASNVKTTTCESGDCIFDSSCFEYEGDFKQPRLDLTLQEVLSGMILRGKSEAEIISVTKNWSEGFICDGYKCYPTPEWLRKMSNRPEVKDTKEVKNGFLTAAVSNPLTKKI